MLIPLNSCSFVPKKMSKTALLISAMQYAWASDWEKRIGYDDQAMEYWNGRSCIAVVHYSTRQKAQYTSW